MAKTKKVHQTAVISKTAKLAGNVKIGPFSCVGDNVIIEEGTVIGAHVVVERNVAIGANCRVFTGAIIGSIPQDLKYKNEESFLKIGDNNIIREYCTFNVGTGEGGKTVVGNNNLFMAYSHVAHDCLVGNECVIANSGTLAGHVEVEDKVVIGGLTAIHQFVRVGRLAIIGGCSKVVQDIPPYSTCDGHPAKVYGLNLVGLKRAGVSSETIRQLGKAFKLIFNSGRPFKSVLKDIDAAGMPEMEHLVRFVGGSKRGVCRSVTLCRDKE